MKKTSKIYFKELAVETKNDLNELKKILRLLPVEKRSALVNFIVNERDHGPLYIQKQMMKSLSSAFFVPATNRSKATVFFDTHKLSDDFRRLPDIDKTYPLYMECYVGNIKKVSDSVLHYSKILCEVNDLIMAEFKEGVQQPDTIEETKQKAVRYAYLKKTGISIHNNKLETSKDYRLLTENSTNAPKGGFISKNLKRLENLPFLLFKRQINENQNN